MDYKRNFNLNRDMTDTQRNPRNLYLINNVDDNAIF